MRCSQNCRLARTRQVLIDAVTGKVESWYGTRRVDIRRDLGVTKFTEKEELRASLTKTKPRGEGGFVVGLAGVEPATLGLGNQCSIHLSYRP
jgi:hypothetical protein